MNLPQVCRNQKSLGAVARRKRLLAQYSHRHENDELSLMGCWSAACHSCTDSFGSCVQTTRQRLWLANGVFAASVLLQRYVPDSIYSHQKEHIHVMSSYTEVSPNLKVIYVEVIYIGAVSRSREVVDQDSNISYEVRSFDGLCSLASRGVNIMASWLSRLDVSYSKKMRFLL